jgi:hypothetical protein
VRDAESDEKNWEVNDTIRQAFKKYLYYLLLSLARMRLCTMEFLKDFAPNSFQGKEGNGGQEETESD